MESRILDPLHPRYVLTEPKGKSIQVKFGVKNGKAVEAGAAPGIQLLIVYRLAEKHAFGAHSFVECELEFVLYQPDQELFGNRLHHGLVVVVYAKIGKGLWQQLANVVLVGANVVERLLLRFGL